MRAVGEGRGRRRPGAGECDAAYLGECDAGARADGRLGRLEHSLEVLDGLFARLLAEVLRVVGGVRVDLRERLR